MLARVPFPLSSPPAGMTQQKSSRTITLKRPGSSAAKCKPVPELVIIADRAGFRWLSEYFKACAKRTKRLSGMPMDLAIEEHWHPSLRLPPFDHALSDELELRVVPFDASTRDRLLERYGVDRKRAKRGSLIKRSAKMVAEIQRCMTKGD